MSYIIPAINVAFLNRFSTPALQLKSFSSMLEREFEKAGIISIVFLDYYDNRLHYDLETQLSFDPNVLIDDGVEVRRHVTKIEEFKNVVQQRLAQGWTETRRSLSRRCFVQKTDAKHRFWVIQFLHQDTFETKIGDMPKGGHGNYLGRRYTTYAYETVDEALGRFHEQIKKRIKEGFIEFHPRQNAYSSLPADVENRYKQIKKEQSAAKRKAKTPKSPPSNSAPRTVQTEVYHRHLPHPTDAFWAIWRDPDPLPMPNPRPFNKPAVLEAIRKGRGKGGAFVLPLPPRASTKLSPQEAHFWLVAQNYVQKNKRSLSGLNFTIDIPDLIANLQNLSFDPQNTPAEFFKAIDWTKPVETQFLADLVGGDCIVELARDARCQPGNWSHEFRVGVLPYLSRQRRAQLQQEIALLVEPTLAEPPWRWGFPPIWKLASLLGCHDTVRKCLDHPTFKKEFSQPQALAWGLGGEDEVASFLEELFLDGRLGRDQWSPAYCCAWLAHTKTDYLPFLIDQVQLAFKNDAVAFLEAISPACHPDLALPFLFWREEKHLAPVANQWLDTNLATAIAGLLSGIEGEPRAANLVLTFFHQKVQAGYQPLIESIASTLPEIDWDKIKHRIIGEKIQPLLNVLHPPKNPLHSRDDPNWDLLQEKIAFDFPVEFFDFGKSFGTGVISLGPHNLHIANPLDAQYPAWVLKTCQKYQDLEDLKTRPSRFYPEKQGMVPFAFDHSGVCCFFKPTSDGVVAATCRNSDPSEFHCYPHDFLVFLLELFTNELNPPLFVADDTNHDTKSDHGDAPKFDPKAWL